MVLKDVPDRVGMPNSKLMSNPHDSKAPPKKSKKVKPKDLPRLNVEEWQDVFRDAESPLLAEILADKARCDDVLGQLGAALRNGVLAHTSAALRFSVLDWFACHCTQLCAGSNLDRIRMIYETLRDDLRTLRFDSKEVADSLKDAAMKVLTTVLIKLDAPRMDPRLTKVHIEMLFRWLEGKDAPERASNTAARNALKDRRLLAAESLLELEMAYPTLFAFEVTAFLDMAEAEASNPSPGFVFTQLAATALGHLASLYLTQREEGPEVSDCLGRNMPLVEEKYVLNSDNESEDGIVPISAARELCLPQEVLPTSYSDEDDQDLAYGEEVGLTRGLHSKIQEAVIVNSCAQAASKGDAEASPSGGPKGDEHSTASSSPRGVLHKSSTLPSSVPSKEGSQVSLARDLSGMDSSEDSTSGPAAIPVLPVVKTPRSALTTALRPTGAPSNEAQCNDEVESNQTAVQGTTVVSTTSTTTPLDEPPELPLLIPSPAPRPRHFQVPQHIVTGDASCAPRLLITPEAQTRLQSTSTLLVSVMRRLGPQGVLRIAATLPPILRAARPSPTALWPFFERLLATGNTTMVGATLDLHDTVPELFEGRGPALVEKVLAHANDASHSLNHRVVVLSWVLRQHAIQQHHGGELLLADSWDRLLLQPGEPPQVAAIKVKALAACLSVGLGDAETVTRNVCSFGGFVGAGAGARNQQRALTYALRLLHGAVPQETGAAHRTHACLVVAIMEAIVTRPQLVPAVDAFLATCPQPAFVEAFVRAFDAMLSCVDGQFELLRELPDDAAYPARSRSSSFGDKARELADSLKAAVISRASSLAGLLRGLTLRLSFANRTHSVLQSGPSTSRGQRVPVHSAVPVSTQSLLPNLRLNSAASGTTVDVDALRSSVASAFKSQAQARDTQHLGGIPRQLSFTTCRVREGGAAAVHGPGSQRMGEYIDDESAVNRGSSLLSGDEVEGGDGLACVAPMVPFKLGVQERGEVEAWLSAAGTWECLAPGVLHQDLMSYRLLLKRAVTGREVHPRGSLRALANYAWQYKEAHPSHALPAKETAEALFGLCLATALDRLMVENSSPDGWTLRQCEVADGVQGVLDAMEDTGFPVLLVRPRVQALAGLVAQENAWVGGLTAEALKALLVGYVEATISA